MTENIPITCAKCHTLVGSDAVFLKNGTYMCPACYQRAYPVKAKPGKPKRFDISVEGVIAIIVVAGVVFLGYKVYDYVVASRRAEALAAQKAEEAAEARRLEDQARADERARKAEIFRRETEERLQAERIAKAEAQKLAAAERLKAIELAKAEAEKRRLEEEQRLAAMKKKLEAEKNGDTAEGLKARQTELAAIARIITDAQKKISAAETAKNEHLRKSVAYKSFLRTAEDTRNSLLRQYRAEFPPTTDVRDPNDIPNWRNPPAPKVSTNATGQGAVVVDHSASYAKLVAKFDSAAKDLQTNGDALKFATDEIAKLDSIIDEAKAKIDESNHKLIELKATPEEIASNGVNATAHRPGLKTIWKKDGSQIKAQSVIAADDEIRYKDEKGAWQVVKKADVEKVE